MIIKSPFGSVKISGYLDVSVSRKRETNQSATYQFNVLAEDNGPPEGLAKMIDILEKLIEDPTITEEPTTTSGP